MKPRKTQSTGVVPHSTLPEINDIKCEVELIDDLLEVFVELEEGYTVLIY